MVCRLDILVRAPFLNIVNNRNLNNYKSDLYKHRVAI